MKQRLLPVFLTVCLLLSLFSCSPKEDNGKITVLCTLFPQYDWLRNITEGSDTVDLKLIIANGTDPHSYQPTAADIADISKCDMIVYVGGDSDTWVEKAIERSKNSKIKSIILSELDGITLQNISAGSHSHEGHSHEGHSHKEEHSEEHSHSVFDEHLYLSLNNAAVATKELAQELCLLDKDNEELYRKNAEEYISKLQNLDLTLKEKTENASGEPFMLFADRFPFVYLLADYGIDYSAAFESCTTDTNADFDTVIRLIKEADLHNVKYIAVTESSDGSLAKTVISSTKSKDQKIIVLNSLQSVNQAQIKNGITYISVMEENINSILTATGIN